MRAGLSIAIALALLVPGAATAGPYDSAPETEIVSGPADVSRAARPTFEFRSPDDPEAEFECSLGDEPFRACTSPWTVPSPLAQGTYTLRVRAVNRIVDETDPTPAVRTFSIDRNITGANARAGGVQRLRGRDIALVVTVHADEHVRASAGGKLRIGKSRSYRVASDEATLEAGATRRLILRSAKPKLGRKARKALKKGKPVDASLTATFTDDVGNRATTGEIGVRLRR